MESEEQNDGQHRPSRKRKRAECMRTRKTSLDKRFPRKARKTSMPVWVVEEIQPEENLSTFQEPISPPVSQGIEFGSREAQHTAQQTAQQHNSEQPTTSFTINEVLKLVSTLQDNQKSKPHQLNNNHMNNVIPEFDPSSEAQNIDSWLRKVNECTLIYEWDQKQTMHFALQKLTGFAKKWFEALPSVNYSWDEWQAKLRKAFPKEQNYGRLLEEMLARTSRHNENLREYFYDKLSLLNRCEIQGQKAIDCIIHGILDKSIRNGAQALNCREPEDLLSFLNSQRLPDNVTFTKKRNDNLQPHRSNNSVPNQMNITCFNCRGRGHPYQKCPNPLVKCQKCFRVGHDSATCKLHPLTLRQTNDSKVSNEDRKTLAISTFNNTNDKFYKKVTVNGHDLLSFIDFGSECSLMQETEAKKLNLTKNYNALPAIRGFGNATVSPVYKSSVTLRLDEVEACLEILIVPDEFLHTAIFVGQNFTELPSVTVLKDAEKLLFYKSPVVTESTNQSNIMKLTTFNSVEVQRIGLVLVNTEDPSYCGDIHVEGYDCAEPGREYHLHQGAYRIDEGKGHIVVTNLGQGTLSFSPNLLIARATPIVERKICNVNRICKDLSQIEPLDRNEIQVGKNVSNEDVDKLHKLLQSYRDCFAMNLGEIGLAKDVEMTIDLNDDRPIVYRPYRLSFAEREQVRTVIEDLLQNDIIQESDSEFASPILMVKKKTGEQRLCVDFRALNNKTRKDCFPLPLIEDQLNNLSGNRFFTSLDLASGYYQIPMAQGSRRFTGFVTPDGHYEFKRMPFGLANAPAVFQRLVNKMLGAKRFGAALAYLDDILVPSVDLQQGFQRLEEVLKLLREFGLTLKLSKCRFFDSVITYLGYEISVDGIRPNEDKILAVKLFPVPRNVHEVRQFLGLAGYFRKFVKGFGEIARPLTNLLKKDIPFEWTDRESSAFHLLKDKLVERPILSLYNPKLDTELHTDASAHGIGGILLQWQENPRVLKPVAYFSRQTTPEERHLHSYELETLAIVCSLKKFRVYLLGVNFKVVTDCHALRTTLVKRDLVPRIARWWLQISEFAFDIEYRPGTQMAHVDALSRNTKLNEPNENPITTVYNIDTEPWLLTLQVSDPDIARIMKVLKPENDEESKDIRKNFAMKDHKVYRKVGDKLYLVVPRSARFQVCQLNHDEAGHLGETKTIERIQTHYWFPKLRKFVKKYVRSCIQCAYNKDNAKNTKAGHLYPISKVDIPFHTIHIDHLGPFTKSKKGNAYILTVVDGYTKYVFVRPVKDTKTRSTIKVLKAIFDDFLLPSRIISDRGTSFTSGEFKKFCDLHGIKHILNAVACPRANGQAERFNQTILNSLARHNTGKEERDWDTWLGKIQHGINNSVHSTTKKTASEALFGCKPRDSLMNKLGIGIDEKSENIESIRKTISDNIETAQQKQKLNYDNGRAPAVCYNVGDLIKITRTNFYNKGNSTKLLSKFIGPYKIVKVLGNDRYKISNVPGFNKKCKSFETIVAADRMRPWINTCPTNSNINKPSDNSRESSDYDSEDNLPLSELQQQCQVTSEK